MRKIKILNHHTTMMDDQTGSPTATQTKQDQLAPKTPAVRSRGNSVIIEEWGLIPYEQAWARQKRLVEEISQQGGPDRLVLCQHPCVITLGRSSSWTNLLISRDELQKRGIVVHETDRGGDVTLHAPGQWVMYVLRSLKKTADGLHGHLRRLEDWGMALLETFGLKGSRDPRGTGVWVQGAKIMAIGIGVKKWVTYHGAALNVDVDLSLFRLIRPCGLEAPVTSLSHLGVPIPSETDMKSRVIKTFMDVFETQ